MEHDITVTGRKGKTTGYGVGQCQVEGNGTLGKGHWKGTREYSIDEGYKVWYCGHEKKRQHEVELIIDKQPTEYCSALQCLNEGSRLELPQSIIQVHAPISDYDDQVVEEFYEDL